MSKLKIGIIGCGGRGTTYFSLTLNYFAATCELVAICDKYQTQIDKKKEKYNLELSKQININEYVGETAYINMLATETLDFVFIATPWEYHAKMVIECMNNGIRSGSEVPLATTEEECERIYETYKKTGVDACIMENVCWREDVMAVLNMKRMGLFGTINYASGGYMHDIRTSLVNQSRYIDWWRGEHYKHRVGDNYPTHGLGPVQNWLDINKGNRMTKLTAYSNNALGINDILNKTKHTINKYYNKELKTGDIVKTLIQTARGELIEITLNTTNPRPYSLDFSLQGTTGLWDRRLGIKSSSKIYLETVTENTDSSDFYTLGDLSCQGTHRWDDGDVYITKYKHPVHMKYTGKERAGHGGMDWYMYNSIINCVKNNEKFETSLEDSITMSLIVDLSRKSLLQGNRVIDIPDFTDGFWMSDNSFFENCFYFDSYDIIPYNDDIYYTIITNYASNIHEKNDFNLYHYSNNFTEPIQYTYSSTLDDNNTFAISNLDNIATYNYLGFNKGNIHDDHYIIASTIENIKCVEFFLKMYETQPQDYWCYLLDGRPGNDTTYIAFREGRIALGSNIEKIILNNETIIENIAETVFNALKKHSWNSLKIYFTKPVTDDLSLFSKFNNEEDFNGGIANLKIYDSNDTVTNSYDFISYNKENRFLNSINNEYDLKVTGEYITGKIHDLNMYNTEILYNAKTDSLNEHNSNDIILFFKKDNIDTEKDKLVIY